MSRARPIPTPDGDLLWFDVKQGNDPATDDQLELLATVQCAELEDLLDPATFGADVLTQAEVLKALREALGQTIPPEIIARRERYREERRMERDCRICGKPGDSTKHHFVNRWMLKELEGYQRHWADRRRNCIPLCIHCHRDLHMQSSNRPKSIAPHLNDTEKAFAEEAVSAIYDQKPMLFKMIARGDSSVYETRLIRDWIEGKFVTEDG